ncbi:hypothetical protein AAVH_05300 [Aphelenchoides avenae]|nr:hypothetical protein AAVH_05300 [Aphelenchus avenae]
MSAERNATDETPRKPPRLDVQTICVNDKLMCAYKDGLLYEANVVSISGQPGTRKFKLHYPAWGKQYDEVVPKAKAAALFHEYTPEVSQRYKDLHKQRLDAELKAERRLKRRHSTNDTHSSTSQSENTEGRPSSKVTSSSTSKSSNTVPDAKRHRPDGRYEAFRTLVLQKAQKHNNIADDISNTINFISKSKIAKEIQREAAEHRFTDYEANAFFERLLEDNIIMFENDDKDLFLMI